MMSDIWQCLQAQRDDADHGGHQLHNSKACESCDQLNLLHGVVAQHVGQSCGRTRVDQLLLSSSGSSTVLWSLVV